MGGENEKGIRTVVSSSVIRFWFNVCGLQKARRSSATTTATSISSSARANAATDRC